MAKLELEFRDDFIKATDIFGNKNTCIMVTPPIDEEYWVFRIKLFKDQSMVAFPKFGLIGIGFAREEEDWNTNLPSHCDADYIYNHIKCNKKYKQITKKTCVEAIEILKKAAEYYKKHEAPKESPMGELNGVADYVKKLYKYSFKK